MYVSSSHESFAYLYLSMYIKFKSYALRDAYDKTTIFETIWA